MVPSLWKVKYKLGFTDFVLQNSTVTGATNVFSKITVFPWSFPAFVIFFQMCSDIIQGEIPYTVKRKSREMQCKYRCQLWVPVDSQEL